MLSAAANRMAKKLPLKKKKKKKKKKKVEKNLAHLLYQYSHASSLNIFLSNMNTIYLSCSFRMTHTFTTM